MTQNGIIPIFRLSKIGSLFGSVYDRIEWNDDGIGRWRIRKPTEWWPFLPPSNISITIPAGWFSGRNGRQEGTNQKR